MRKFKVIRTFNGQYNEYKTRRKKKRLSIGEIIQLDFDDMSLKVKAVPIEGVPDINSTCRDCVLNDIGGERRCVHHRIDRYESYINLCYISYEEQCRFEKVK